MARMPHNIEKSAFRRGEYIGYDSNGERYRIIKNGPRQGRGSWWVYPQTVGGIPLFYAGTLAVVGIRLERRESTSAVHCLPHESQGVRHRAVVVIASDLERMA